MKKLCLLLLICAVFITKINNMKARGKFANLYTPDKDAHDCNRHSWKSCYEIRKNKCVSYGWVPIPMGCVVVYDKCNYLGTAKIICGSLNKLGRMNKKISSVKLGPSTKVQLFCKKRLTGKSIKLSFNEPCLINHKFNSKTQSVKISVTSH